MADGTPDDPDAPSRTRRITFRDTPPSSFATQAPAAPKPVPQAPAARPAQPAAPAAKAPPVQPGPPVKPQPAPQPAAPPGAIQHPVKPPAKAAKPRRRHYFLLFSFILIVALPLLVSVWYLWFRAVDQYASDVAFSVRTEEQGSAIELLGGITELSGSSSSDTDILYAYLSSQELVTKVNTRVDLRAIWSRPGVRRDPIFVFDPEGTIEDLVEHWERKISVVYDSGTRLIDLEVLAFDPQDALAIAQAVLDECAQMINDLSKIAQEDAISFTRDELSRAEDRLKQARRALTEFRNRTQIVDPSIDTQNQMGLLVTLQQQLADALIENDLLRDTTRADDPRITQAERRIEVINERIASERRKLGLGDGAESGQAFANLVGEYEELIVNREFAETAYTAALAANDGAKAEARKQSRYLAAHVKPTLAERAEYPKRELILGLLALFSFFSWAIFCLIYYSLRDRS